ncbi:MAG: hypothetical protein K2N56_08470 [Oscillospiraceae bacterium]|nr:hypothetical protein [Oscillospiraceae bacterium]
MLSQTLLQSAFEDLRDLSSKNNGSFVGSENTGEFDEMLTDKLVPDAVEETAGNITYDTVLRACRTVPEYTDADNSAFRKPSQLSEYLGGFNALSGLLVRFWKKKELVDIEKGAAKDQDESESSPRRAPQKKNSGNSAAGELSELSHKKKK